MDDTTPNPEDQELLDRLAAAGPVLDQLYAEAAEGIDGAPAPSPGSDHPHGLRRPNRRRTSRSRGRAVATVAIVLLVVVGAIAAVMAGRDRQENITTDQTTTTTEFVPSPELAALVQERVDAIDTCGPAPTEDEWPRPWPDGFKLVVAPNCDTGWTDEDDEAVQPIPVVADPDKPDDDPIAYWSPSTGWIPIEEWEDPDFDLADYRAAFEAEVDSRGSTSGD